MPEDINDKEVDLFELTSCVFFILSKKRKFIINGVGIATGMAVIIACLLPKTYESKGFLQIPISLSSQPSAFAYKRDSSMFTDVDNFFAFVMARQYFSPEEIKDLRASIRESSDLTRFIRPVFNKSVLPGEDHSDEDIIGLEISGWAANPQKAQHFAFIISEFIKSALLLDRLHDYIINNQSQLADSDLKLENTIYEDGFQSQQLSVKKDDLEKIKSRYPGTAMEIRQIFSVHDAGYQYLSPTTDIVKTDMDVSDFKREELKTSRDKAMIEFKMGFFNKAADFLRENVADGEALLQKLEALKSGYFNNVPALKDKDPERETANSIAIDLDSFNDTYLNKIRFVAGPTLPFKKAAPKRLRIIIAVFFISALLLTLYVVCDEWWQNNKDRFFLQDTATARDV